jgi:hypothetical protein
MRKRLVGWLVTVAWSGTSALFYNAWSLLYAFSVTQPTYIGVMGRVSPAVMLLNTLLATQLGRFHACHP